MSMETLLTFLIGAIVAYLVVRLTHIAGSPAA